MRGWFNLMQLSKSGYYEPDLCCPQDETIETHGRYVVLEAGQAQAGDALVKQA